MYKPKYRITKYILGLVEKASFFRGWIEKSPIDVAVAAFLVKQASIGRTHASTSIEGNPLTIKQIEQVSKNKKNIHNIYETEVINYLKALKFIENKTIKVITEQMVKKLHEILTQNTIPEGKSGYYKKKQNFVVNEKGIRIYSPPSPKKTPLMMKELVDWLNLKETNDMNPVIVSAIFHHRFVSIHPFSDGNGRLARLIGTAILYKNGFDTKHIYNIDDYFAGDRKKYYEKIQQARELDEDLTYWIEYVCEGVVASLKDAKIRIDKLSISPIYNISFSKRQEEIMQIIIEKGVVTSRELQDLLKLTRSRIHQILVSLIDVDLIGKSGMSKATKYFLKEKLSRTIA